MLITGQCWQGIWWGEGAFEHEKAPLLEGGMRALVGLDGWSQYLFQPKGVACASEAFALRRPPGVTRTNWLFLRFCSL